MFTNRKNFKSLTIARQILILTLLMIQIQPRQIQLINEKFIFSAQIATEEVCSQQMMIDFDVTMAEEINEIFGHNFQASSLAQFTNKLGDGKKNLTTLIENLTKLLSLEITTQKITSPTGYSVNDQFTNSKKIKLLTEEFFNRLRLDEFVYHFAYQTVGLLIHAKAIQDSSKISLQDSFLKMKSFDKFTWIKNNNYPIKLGSTIIQKEDYLKQKFEISDYEYWSLYRHLHIRDSEEKIFTLEKQIQKYKQNLEYLAQFKCDLYAAFLFDFYNYVNLSYEIDNSSFIQLTEKLDLAYNINESFFNEVAEGKLCPISKDVETVFFEDFIGLQKTEISGGITIDQNFLHIISHFILHLDEIKNFDDKELEEFYFFDTHLLYLNFNFYKAQQNKVIKKGGNIATFEAMYYREIFSLFKKFDKVNQGKKHFIMITLQFFEYLYSIKKDKSKTKNLKEEIIDITIQVQYQIFCIIRSTLKSEDLQKITDLKTFMELYFIKFLKTKLRDHSDPNYRYILMIDELVYEETIITIIETITTYFIEIKDTYEKVTEALGETLQFVKIQQMKEIPTLLQTKMQKYVIIEEKHFNPIDMFVFIFIYERVDDLLEFISFKKDQELANSEQKNHSHLKLKQALENFVKKIFVNIMIIESKKLKPETFEDNIKNDYKSALGKTKIDHIVKEKKKYESFTNEFKGCLEKFQNMPVIIFKWVLDEMIEHLEQNQYSLEFLNFIQKYEKLPDAQFTSTSQSKHLDITVDMNFKEGKKTIVLENGTYESKWNQYLLLDSAFLYTMIVHLNREDLKLQGDDCSDFNPFINREDYYQVNMIERTEEEVAHAQEEQRVNCITQREIKFKGLLKIEKPDDSLSDYLQSIMVSPEILVQYEQQMFMVDSFQLFQGFLDNDGILINSNANEIFYFLYRFLIQIRTYKNFVYSYNFFEIIDEYLEKCLSYQSTELDDELSTLCVLGYGRYNEIYWFVNFFKAVHQGHPEQIIKAFSSKWGQKENARTNVFSYFLMNSIGENSSQTDLQDISEKQKNIYIKVTNMKNKIFQACEDTEYLDEEGKQYIHYCNLLNKIKKLVELTSQVKVYEEEYETLQAILKEETDIGKLASWEAIDYLAHLKSNSSKYENYEHFQRILDTNFVKRIMNNSSQTGSIFSELMQIKDKKMLTDYGYQKFNWEITYNKRYEQTQALKKEFENQNSNGKKGDNIDELIKTIFSDAKNIKDLIMLKNKESHNKLFKDGFVHDISVAWLICYSKSKADFQKIVNELGDKINFLFLANSNICKTIYAEYENYIKRQIIDKSWTLKLYTIENLKIFISGIQKEIAGETHPVQKNVSNLQKKDFSINSFSYMKKDRKARFKQMEDKSNQSSQKFVQFRSSSDKSDKLSFESFDSKVKKVDEENSLNQSYLSEQFGKGIASEIIKENSFEKLQNSSINKKTLSESNLGSEFQDQLRQSIQSTTSQIGNMKIEKRTVTTRKVIVTKQPSERQSTHFIKELVKSSDSFKLI